MGYQQKVRRDMFKNLVRAIPPNLSQTKISKIKNTKQFKNLTQKQMYHAYHAEVDDKRARTYKRKYRTKDSKLKIPRPMSFKQFKNIKHADFDNDIRKVALAKQKELFNPAKQRRKHLYPKWKNYKVERPKQPKQPKKATQKAIERVKELKRKVVAQQQKRVTRAPSKQVVEALAKARQEARQRLGQERVQERNRQQKKKLLQEAQKELKEIQQAKPAQPKTGLSFAVDTMGLLEELQRERIANLKARK